MWLTFYAIIATTTQQYPEIKLGRKIKLKTYVNILQGIFSKFENYKQIINAGMLDYRGFFAMFSHLKPQNSNHQMKNTLTFFHKL